MVQNLVLKLRRTHNIGSAQRASMGSFRHGCSLCEVSCSLIMLFHLILFFRNINIHTMTCGHLNSMCFHIFSLDSSCFFFSLFLKKKIFYFKWNAFIRSSSVVHWFRMNCFLVLDTHTLLLGNFTFFLFHLLYFVQLDHMCCFCFYYHVNNCL